MSDDQFALDLQPPRRNLPHLWTPDDIYRIADEEVVRDFAEDNRVERKRVEVSKRDLAEYMSMWANTQPQGGIVFIGVANDGRILGCRHSETSHLNDLESARRLCPDAQVEFKRVGVVNDKGQDDLVIMMRVFYRHDRLVETEWGEAFTREGDTKRRLTEAEKREIRINRGEVDFELERVNLKYPGDFDLVLIQEYYRQYISKRRLSRDKNTEDVLQLSKLGVKTRDSFRPNIACAILFAKDPQAVIPGAFIRVRRYAGIEERFGEQMNSVADDKFEGPLPHQISQAEKFIESQMRNFTRLGRDGKFVTSPEYPKDVWLEALVNAAVHRSYNLRHMNIFVKIFEDKMVIESPGTFMPPTTAETVYESHNPRNPNLMWAMYYFERVQCAFEGTRRMRAFMRAANLPDPIFTSKELGASQVSVALENALEHRKAFIREEAAPGVDAKLYASLTQEEKMLVNALADGSAVNVNEAGLIIGRDWRATKAVFDSLEAKGLIGRTPGKARNRHRQYFLRLTRP
jgi:ATP-dependent DNA helicase RecG